MAFSSMGKAAFAESTWGLSSFAMFAAMIEAAFFRVALLEPG